MLFRLLLTLSLIGAWSLPALGCGGNSTRVFDFKSPISYTTLEMLRNVDFDVATQHVDGGGTWYDSRGRKGTFSSQLSTLDRAVQKCSGCIRSCHYETEVFHRYSIELDDGRREWFKWKKVEFARDDYELVKKSVSEEYPVDMTFVRRADESGSRAIVIADGDYTLTLVEDKIAGIPSRITYIPRSKLHPHRSLERLLDISHIRGIRKELEEILVKKPKELKELKELEEAWKKREEELKELQQKYEKARN